ncbi:MAG TPA: hypothetical protein VMA54_10090 [Steroidobacteraceae bacterium]|nr:hypothetical protein [Steroidobacteraceae bacterium]
MPRVTRPSNSGFLVLLVAVPALCACGASAADAHVSQPRDTRYPGTIQLAVDAR